ncbi:MAG: hypothetical protein IPI67_12660 [Myxococcales bacterium]|nr:hypothetical protein [Myxococcales bacterium]
MAASVPRRKMHDAKPANDPERLLDELVAFARGMGISVRMEPMRLAMHHASGGLIRLNGQALVLIDSKSPLFDRVLTLADAVAPLAVTPLPESLSPESRELIETARAKREGRAGRGESRERQVKVFARPKPGLRRTRPR